MESECDCDCECHSNLQSSSPSMIQEAEPQGYVYPLISSPQRRKRKLEEIEEDISTDLDEQSAIQSVCQF